MLKYICNSRAWNKDILYRVSHSQRHTSQWLGSSHKKENNLTVKIHSKVEVNFLSALNFKGP